MITDHTPIIKTQLHVKHHDECVTDDPFRVLQVRIRPGRHQGPVDQQLSPFSTRWVTARWSCQDFPDCGNDPSVTAQAIRRRSYHPLPLTPTAVALSTRWLRHPPKSLKSLLTVV
jgi:hypothetical protein